MKKFGLNWFDGVVIAILMTLVLAVLISVFYKSSVHQDDITIKIKVDNAGTIQAVTPYILAGDTVYINGSNKTVTTVGQEIINDPANGQPVLYITLKAPGTNSDGYYTFNGQRILINQKVEVHGKYTVQGYVMDIK